MIGLLITSKAFGPDATCTRTCSPRVRAGDVLCEEKIVRKIMVVLMAGTLLILGVACDDNEKDGAKSEKIDEDDTRVGPGDGKDEVGPGR